VSSPLAWFSRSAWTPQLTSLLDIPPRDLPMIWDADFMLGPPSAEGSEQA